MDTEFYSTMRYLLIILIIFESLYSRPLYYMEEFIDIHYMPSYTNKHDLRRNIYWLEFALKSPIKPADRIDVPTVIYRDYEKYQLLTVFYVYYLICLNYLRLAGLFNKLSITWHDIFYYKEIMDSYSIAEYYYKVLGEKWKLLKSYELKLRDYDDIELENTQYIEEILEKVRDRVVDYNYISIREIDNISKHKKSLEDFKKDIRFEPNRHQGQ